MRTKMSTKVESSTEKSHLSEHDIHLLLVLCTKLLKFCADVTGEIDPAAAAMLTYVRDDILSESKIKLPS
jgi:hypothetical protein